MAEGVGKSYVTYGSLEKLAVNDGSLEFEWKTPNLFSLANEYEYKVRSPHFEFFGAEYAIDTISMYTEVYIGIILVRADLYSYRHAKFSVEIKFIDGGVYKSADNKKTVGVHIYFTEPKIVLPKSALEKEMATSPQGVVIIFCRLCVNQEFGKKTSEASATQTGLSEDLFSVSIFNLRKNLKDLLTSGKDSDVVMKVGDKEFQTHRAILGARSTVFTSMFQHNMKERGCGTVDITDCDPQVFRQFLLYVYTGKVDCLTSENVCQLYKVADKYDIQDLKTECVEYMKENLSTDNFCDVISLSLQHSESDLTETATQYFVKNAKKIVITVNWLSFMKENTVEGNELTIKALNFAFPD